MLDLDTRLVVGRVTYRLLRSLDDPNAVEAAVREILPQLRSLSAKQEVISDVGYRESAGHKLVSEIAASELEKEWRNEVHAATASELSKESDLLRVVLVARREADPSEEPVTIDDHPELTLALLKGARSEVRSQSMGSRAVTRSTRLAWDVLVELLGGRTPCELGSKI